MRTPPNTQPVPGSYKPMSKTHLSAWEKETLILRPASVTSLWWTSQTLRQFLACKNALREPVSLLNVVIYNPDSWYSGYTENHNTQIHFFKNNKCNLFSRHWCRGFTWKIERMNSNRKWNIKVTVVFSQMHKIYIFTYNIYVCKKKERDSVTSKKKSSVKWNAQSNHLRL